MDREDLPYYIGLQSAKIIKNVLKRSTFNTNNEPELEITVKVTLLKTENGDLIVKIGDREVVNWSNWASAT